MTQKQQKSQWRSLRQASTLDLFSAARPNEFAQTLSFLLEFWVLLLEVWVLLLEFWSFCLIFKVVLLNCLIFYLIFYLFTYFLQIMRKIWIFVHVGKIIGHLVFKICQHLEFFPWVIEFFCWVLVFSPWVFFKMSKSEACIKD